MTRDELREHLRKALRTAGFVDPDDGTVPMWPNGDQWPSNGCVWVRHGQLIDTIVNNWPYPIHDDALDRLDCDDPNGGFDELVASNVKIHLEMESESEAYMNIYPEGGIDRFAQVFISARKNKLNVVVEDSGVWR